MWNVSMCMQIGFGSLCAVMCKNLCKSVSNFAHPFTVKYFGTLFGTKQKENDIFVLKTTLENPIFF